MQTNHTTARVGIYGATGYTGQILLEILAKHPYAKVVFATSESSKETLDGLELIPSEQAPLHTDADMDHLVDALTELWSACPLTLEMHTKMAAE